VAVTNVGFLWSGGWRRRLERRACRQILAESRNSWRVTATRLAPDFEPILFPSDD
jgi:hypothetical protein